MFDVLSGSAQRVLQILNLFYRFCVFFNTINLYTCEPCFLFLNTVLVESFFVCQWTMHISTLHDICTKEDGVIYIHNRQHCLFHGISKPFMI